MLSQASALEGGFSDPVLDAQAAFRAIMDAMARPATVHSVPALVRPPAPLGRAAGAVACALIDADTPFWLDDALGLAEAPRVWLGFHTGAGQAASLPQAAFALIGDPARMPRLERFAQGSQDYPDRSATLILQLDGLTGGPALTFEGPGIDGSATLAPRGLPADFAGQWAENRARFPRGVDLILTAGDAIACLPRSARPIRAEG
ncbi:MAG TPA: phosphonate C-P lyase system protein PhnH [Mesorhizobium sp.]|nr:phosphonate C-P lyase system protein PhnH [Mesorhizobium sp.]